MELLPPESTYADGDRRPCLVALDAPVAAPAARLISSHKIEFSFLNGNLMVPTGDLLIC
jgi:hypothetical protein